MITIPEQKEIKYLACTETPIELHFFLLGENKSLKSEADNGGKK